MSAFLKQPEDVQLEDMVTPILQLFVGDEGGPDGPDDPGPTDDQDRNSDRHRKEVDAFWAGRNRAHRRSAKVAA